jgi:hypothetical protein
MALSITDIVAASADAVISSKAANQWSESALLRFLDKKGFVKRMDFGATIEVPLDYVANAGGAFLATDITATSLSKTSILGAASYSIAELSVPMVWTKKQEAMNPSENQKVNYVKTLIENALETHDDLIETALLAATATEGFNSIPVIITEDGTGTIGGIVAGTDTMWKNQFDDYGAETDLNLTLAQMSNACAKGSGGSEPTLIVTSATTHADYEADLVAIKRIVDAKEASGGFKALSFRNAQVIFSHRYTSDSLFLLNPKALQLCVSKSHYRKRGETNEVDASNSYVTKLYSALQLVTSNRSRLGVSFT